MPKLKVTKTIKDKVKIIPRGRMEDVGGYLELEWKNLSKTESKDFWTTTAVEESEFDAIKSVLVDILNMVDDDNKRIPYSDDLLLNMLEIPEYSDAIFRSLNMVTFGKEELRIKN